MTVAIACIGAAHMDHKASADQAVRLGTSNPVTMTRTLGGVARNVAECLARLDGRVSLVSIVGRDGDGDRVITETGRCGVDMGLCDRSEHHHTACYTALLDHRGELVVALADMAIYDEMTPDRIAPLLPALADHPVWFLDTNFPAPTLRFLLENRPAGVSLLAVDAVSVPKAAKLAGLLDRIDLLFGNRDEIGFLAQRDVRSPLDVCEAANSLLRRGVAAVVVSQGADGSFLASDGTYDFFPAMPARVRDVTGAGDALIAGMLYGQATDRPMAEAMMLGLADAALAVESAETVNPSLNADLLLQRAGILSLA